MSFYQIAKIQFEADVKAHPQAIMEEFDFNAPAWNRSSRSYAKDDGLGKYTLTKIGNKVFNLTLEQLDLFGIDLGTWNEKDYPEREKWIKDVLAEVSKGLGSEARVTSIIREVK